MPGRSHKFFYTAYFIGTYNNPVFPAAGHGEQAKIFKYITKPWKLEEEFKPAIRQAVEYYNFHRESELAKTDPV